MVQFTRHEDGFRLHAVQRLPIPRERVFPFFADARNLEKLTPPHLSFAILDPGPLVMREGLRIDYRLRLHGIPLRWQSEITHWDPPNRFVDEQRRGPYRRWVHEHAFVAEGDQTLVTDTVDYAVWGGSWVHRLFVQPDLRKIFEHRARVIRGLLSS